MKGQNTDITHTKYRKRKWRGEGREGIERGRERKGGAKEKQREGGSKNNNSKAWL